MSNIIEECKKFIARDVEGFQNHDFKHAQYLVELLPEMNSGKISAKFEELEEKEKIVDGLVSKIVHQRSQEFASLLNKPMIYGEAYDNVKKTVSTSRKRIKRGKELLSKKNNNLKGYLNNSIYNKEILAVLEKVERCHNIEVQIDALMKNESFHEISNSILSLRKEINQFDPNLKDCAVIKHLHENERYKTQEISNLIQQFLRRFFYFFEFEIAIKSYKSKAENSTGFQFDKINLDGPTNSFSDNLSRRFLTMNQVQSETFGDLLMGDYGVNLETFQNFEIKLNQIRMILQSPPKNYVIDYIEDEYLLAEQDAFENIQLLKYISFSLEANQFNKYLELICKAEDLLEKENFPSNKNLDIITLFLAIHSAEETEILCEVFNDYYGNLKRNVHDSLLLVQMFLIKNIWSHLKDEPDQTFFENDESNSGNVSLYHNLTMVQDYNSLLSLTSLGGDFSNEKGIHLEKIRDLLSLYNYNPNTTRHLIQLFKEILMFQIIFIRKNVLLQLILTTMEKKSLQNLPILNIRETWKEFILELDSLFDKIFNLNKISFDLFDNPKESDILFEASLLPGSPFYDDDPNEKKPSQYYPHGNAAKRSLLDDFIIQKLIDLLGVNFMYIPFILSVIHKPIMLITKQINVIYQNTPVNELFQQPKETDLSNYEDDISGFFIENLNKFILLFKLEYIKYINNITNTNKSMALNPEKNSNVDTSQAKTKDKVSSGLKEEKKEETKKEEKKDISQENSTRQSSVRQSDLSDVARVSSRPEIQSQTSVDYTPVEKPSKKTKFDVRAESSKLKYSIPALIQLANNVNLLPSISLHMPMDKGSHMLDLLNWSLNIAYKEISSHLKSTIQGYLIDKVLLEPQESEYMRFDAGLYEYNLNLSQEFPQWRKTMQAPVLKEHMRLLKSKYKQYFLGEATIPHEKLMNNPKHVILLTSTIESLEAFLKTSNFVFWRLLSKMPLTDIINVTVEKVSEKADGATNQKVPKTEEEMKDSLEKLRMKLETSGVQSLLKKFQTILSSSKEPINIYRSIPQESGEIGILRSLYWFNKLYELIQRCFVCLKQELHFRAFAHLIRQGKRAKIHLENNPLELSGHNFTNLFREIFAIYEPIKNSISTDKIAIIFKDYLSIIAKIIKYSFRRSEKISRPYIKTYRQNVQSLEINLKKLDIVKEVLEKKDNPITNIKRFLELFLHDEKEVLNMVLRNRHKVKPKHIELYIQLQNQANEIKLDQNQEMERMNTLNKLSELVKEIEEQTKSKTASEGIKH